MKYRFGEKIRAVRERRGMTLKGLAEKAGVSESLVSQIERNRVSPALDTLLSIIESLDIDLEHFFADYRREREVRIVRSDARTSFSRPGVVYQRLAAMDSGKSGKDGIEAYEIELLPGAKTGSTEYGHEGSELGLIVEGSAELTVGAAVYRLEPGDSVSFASDFPHVVHNDGKRKLKMFWVVTPPKPEGAARS